MENTHNQQHHKHSAPSINKPVLTGMYYCPMHCEGDKTYTKLGDCPKCGMHLVK